MTTEPAPARTAPGPIWLWFTAWSVQGGALLLSDTLGLEGVTKFLVTGFLAALPLVALYLLLRLRGSAEER